MSLKAPIQLGALHKQAIAALSDHSDSARLDAELIICHILKISRTALITQDQTNIKHSQAEQIQSLLERRKLGYPIAYVTGTRHFWDLELKVNEATLIPRPETELLIEVALRLFSKEQNIKVLDLGTGSGAIAIAIAKACENWTVLACDNANAALDIAILNAARYQLANVQFKLSNWFTELSSTSSTDKFDLIISNPPYIEENDPHLTIGDVQFEPQSALCSGHDGLKDIRLLIAAATNYLTPQGWLWLEHGYDQAERVKDLFNENAYHNITQHIDLAGHIRITGAQRDQPN